MFVCACPSSFQWLAMRWPWHSKLHLFTKCFIVADFLPFHHSPNLSSQALADQGAHGAIPQTSDDFLFWKENRFQDKLADSSGYGDAKKAFNFRGLTPDRVSARGPCWGLCQFRTHHLSPMCPQTLVLDPPVQPSVWVYINGEHDYIILEMFDMKSTVLTTVYRHSNLTEQSNYLTRFSTIC